MNRREQFKPYRFFMIYAFFFFSFFGVNINFITVKICPLFVGINLRQIALLIYSTNSVARKQAL